MRVADLNSTVKEIHNKSTSKKQPNKLKDMLLIISNAIQRFEKNGKADSKKDNDKIDFLKNFIADMIKDEDRKQIINGV